MAYNFGLRLMSLSDSGNIEDLYNIIETNLKPLLIKGVYPVNDRDLFRDFIERFTDRYYSRYLNFNTYGELYVKLKFVLENNKKKYQRIYELSLKEIDPLITFNEKETIKEDTTLTGEDHRSDKAETVIDAQASGSNSATGSTNGDGTNTLSFENRNDLNTLSFENRKDHTTFNPTGKEKTTVKNVNAVTSNPKTYQSVPNELSDLKYIDQEQILEGNTVNSFENRRDTTDLTKSGSEKNKLEKNGSEVTSYGNHSDSSSSGSYNDSNNSTTTNSGSSDGTKSDTKDSLITRLKDGFTGNQMELLKMYEALVFDLNNAIINDINDAHLFMTTLA